jgi:nucleoside-diphosphate-sugar epimerase
VLVREPIVVGEPALSNRAVTLVGSGQRKHSFVAMADVAAYTCAALHQQAAQRQTILVGGPEPLSWHDIVAAFEQELVRSVPVRHVPAGVPPPALPGSSRSFLPRSIATTHPST